MFGDRWSRHERFGPGSRRGTAFQKGDLKYVILELLREIPRHGYDIIRELEDRSRGLYKPSPGVIYPTLQMLEEMGYATSAEEEGKKIYSITDEGKKFLDEKGRSGGIGDRIKHHWGFKGFARMGDIMHEYHGIERLLGQGFRRLDDDKAERILGILSRTYEEINAVLSE